jgi:signal recognition particle subunit SRP54
VARDGVAFAREKHHDVVVIDTAGRLGVDGELMQQASDIRDATSPDEVLFVVDAMIGQDAVSTAQAFLDGVGFTGVVLSKLDGDARGGAALSVVGVTGRPVMFASTGEKLEEFELFHPDRMASRILDMGDVLTLIEQAERAFDADQAQAMAAKLAADEDFTLEDFLAQMAALKNMGSIKKMIGMLPGMGELRDQLENFDEREMDRIQAIIQSMTPLERRQPRVLNGSRRARVARGAGVQVSDVNQLLERFTEAQKMMRQMRKGLGGMPGMPGGMPGLPGGGGKKSRGRTAPPGKGKQKGKSGNPAKRAQQEREAAQRRAGAGAGGPAGGAFGLGNGAAPGEVDPASLDLPPGFEKFLGR